MKTIAIIGLLLLTLSAANPGNSPKPADKPVYPAPSGIKNLLFYVQRTVNSNTLVYELNVMQDGNLNEKEPVKVYWIKYSEDGKVHQLTYIQKKYAYGIKAEKLKTERTAYTLQFVSYDKKKFRLEKGNDGKFHVYSYFNNKWNILSNIFIHVNGGSFWLPNVTAVDLALRDPATDAASKEVIIP